MHIKRTLAAVVATAGLAVGLTACNHDSDNVSHNLSQEADQYHVFRDIVVYNGITDHTILEVKGYCALGNHDPASEVTYTCKSPSGYVKDIIEKSDNTFVFVHQEYPENVSENFFEVTLNPTLPSGNLG